MDYMNEYQKWTNYAGLNDEDRSELLSIKNDEKEIESRFFAPLQFGTAGLRGTMGIGLNRMNIYTVGQVTQAIANLICSLGKDAMKRGVVVCYDCRIKSDEFAREVSSILSANQISVYLFDAMRPTPE
ncbi:MAG: phospho-sugar mutase, partial [Clostridiales bacterium]|nr:phospho-sugar mutase [Clostridiales bacterium]